ncbi:MAG: hypothetical protein QM831_41695 [Kofleriaceae bacterium]
MTLADRWAERMPLASRAAAADPMTVWFPLVVDRAGRPAAAEAWARSFTDPRARAVSLARLARQRGDMRLAALAYDESIAAPKGTTLEVLAIIGLPEPIRDHAREIIATVASRDPIGMATRLWCEALYATGDKVRHQQNARRYEGVEFLLDCAAVRAGLPHMPNRPAHDDRERTVAAYSVDKPADVLAFVDYNIASQPEMILRLVELGAMIDAHRLAEHHPAMRAFVAWAARDHAACASVDIPDGALAAIVGAIKIANDLHALDDLAHEHASRVMADGRTDAMRFLAGETHRYPATSDVATTVTFVRRWIVERKPPVIEQLRELFRAALHAVETGDDAKARFYIDVACEADLVKLDSITVSLAIAAMAKADHYVERWIDGNRRLLPQFVARLDGHAIHAYAATLEPVTARALVESRLPTCSRRDLIDVIPTLLALEPGCDAILREGLHAADDSLATLHIV